MYSSSASSGCCSRMSLNVSSSSSSGASRFEPDDTDVASTASVSAQLPMAMLSGVSGTSNVPEAPKRTAAKLASGYIAVSPCTACLAASIRLTGSSEPYRASATAIEPVTSTAITTSVAFTARLVVGVTTLGVSAMTPTSSAITVRRMQAVNVSSLEPRRRTYSATSSTANTAMTAAIAPPTGQPSAGENVSAFIAATSKTPPAMRPRRWPAPTSTNRAHPPAPSAYAHPARRFCAGRSCGPDR